MYGDNIGGRLHPSSPLPHDLMVAARKYGLPRLEAICKRALVAGRQSSVDGLLENDDGASDDEDGLRDALDVAIPASTLAYDLSGALGDQHWADVCFLADGKPIYAHRCVLMARCAYFAAMFRS